MKKQQRNLAIFILLIVIGVFAVSKLTPLSIFSNTFMRSVTYQNVADYEFTDNCEVIPTETSFAITYIPEDVYIAGIDESKSYTRAEIISVFNSANNMFIGRSRQTGLTANEKMGFNSGGILYGQPDAKLGYVIGVSGIRAMTYIGEAYGGSNVAGICRVTYHVEFKQSISPTCGNTICEVNLGETTTTCSLDCIVIPPPSCVRETTNCNEWSICLQGLKVRDCYDNCGISWTENNACSITPSSVCGNSICERYDVLPLENEISCPVDCNIIPSSPPPTDNTILYLSIGMTSILLTVGLLYWRKVI